MLHGERLSLAILLLTLGASGAVAAHRTVLVELFSNVGCGFCAEAEAVLHQLDMEHGDDELFVVEWHMSWPAWDPRYHANPAGNDGRRDFYGIWYVPAMKTDGWLPSNPTSLPVHFE